MLFIINDLYLAAGMPRNFNFHVETCKPDAVRFFNLLDNFGLKQHVMEKTHTCGHTLDLVITRSSENIVSSVGVNDPVLSDHKAVSFKLSVIKPSTLRKKISYRNWKRVDPVLFDNDLKNHELINNPADDILSITKGYNTVLHELAEAVQLVEQALNYLIL